MINDEAAIQHKVSIFPLNIGFGVMILAFTNQSKRLLHMTENKVAASDIEFVLSLLEGVEDYELPHYIKNDVAGVLDFIENNRFFPQNSIATNINAAAISKLILDYLGGKSIRLAPKPIFIDPTNATLPSNH